MSVSKLGLHKQFFYNTVPADYPSYENLRYMHDDGFPANISIDSLDVDDYLLSHMAEPAVLVGSNNHLANTNANFRVRLATDAEVLEWAKANPLVVLLPVE